jgi:UDP-2,3-diacylglucosamine pyrophosphatase LpxH
MVQDIFVISDLHIGDGGPRDNFSYRGIRPKELDLFLSYVEEQKGELILLGDLFEFWQLSLSRVIVRNLPLIDRLGTLNTTYVLGNHDADLKEFIGMNLLSRPLFSRMCGPFVRMIGQRRMKFMHGHELDAFNNGDEPGWGRMLAIFAGIFEAKVGSPMLASGKSVEEALEKFGEGWLRAWNWLVNRLRLASERGDVPDPKKELTPNQNPGRVGEMIKLYAADRIKENVHVLIAGHTHQAGRIGDWYFNSGSWATRENNFLRIRSDGSIGVFNWKDGQAMTNGTTLPIPKGMTKFNKDLSNI